jgi:colanic acid biosynthesis glycosyl transferase WcaI
MKILIYGLNYAPEPIGTGKYTGEMAAWLAARGHDVDVICGLPHYPQWKLDAAHADGRAKVETCDGVKVLRAPHFVPTADGLSARARIRLETGFTFSAARYWLPRLFARRKPDVTIGVMPPMQVAVWPLLLGWLRRVPWVLHVQDLQVDAALRLNMLNVGKFGKLLYWVEGFLLRRATRVSTITESMRARIVAKGTPQDRTWLFPNWADISAIRPGPRDNAFRRALGLADETMVVLYAGNMGEKQGLDSVLDTAVACRDDSRLLFVMVGAGGARPRLERRAAELDLPNLRFLPLQPLEALGDMLAAGDIHLVVQRKDAADLVMPSKLTNILAAGRACVATADPGTALHDVVHGYATGEAVAPGDNQALTEAVRQLAGDAVRRQECGQRARAYAERFLDKDRILATFEDQLKTLCRRGS